MCLTVSYHAIIIIPKQMFSIHLAIINNNGNYNLN